jgi:negative regulator of replication initiation
MGAVYWGYQALEQEEREQLHRLIGEAFDFGVELVKTIVDFCIRTMKDLLDSEEFAQLRKYVAEFAEAVGSSLYEVTGRIYDRVTEIANSAGEAVTSAGTSVGGAASATLNKGRSLIWGEQGKDTEGKT